MSFKMMLPAKMIFVVFAFLLSMQSAFANEWTLNLRDANIRAFITQVSDITGKTFVVDPRVKGKVTVLSSSSLNADEIYSLFQSVLQIHGFVAIQDAEVVKVVQQVDAKQLGGSEKGLSKEELITKVIQVEHASALDFIPIMRPLVAKYGHLAGVSGANAIIISDHRSNIERVEALIAELDKPVSIKTEVIQLTHVWVGDLTPMIQELGSSFQQQSSLKPDEKPSISADENGNRLVVRGGDDIVEEIVTLIRKLDKPSSDMGSMKVIRLNHGNAKDMEELIKGIMSGESTEGKSSFSVFADEGLNALVLRGDPSVIRETETIISQLDVRRAQVMIEAAIVEISEEAGENLGVQLAAGDQSGSSVPLMGTNFNNAGIDLNSVIGAVTGIQVPGFSDGGTFGVGASENKGVTWGLLVQALSSSTSAELLSTPSIITLDNEESEIIVGQNVPFRTGQSSVGGDGLNNPFTTIERRDIGLTLKVTPSISTDGLVRLVVEQSTENVAPSIENASDIVTNKREIKTTVLADNGETIVLGGLIKDDVQKSTSKVPFLGDIPFVGAMFRSESETRVKRNLLVFLRPTIMRNKEDSSKVTQEKYKTLRKIDLSGFSNN